MLTLILREKVHMVVERPHTDFTFLPSMFYDIHMDLCIFNKVHLLIKEQTYIWISGHIFY